MPDNTEVANAVIDALNAVQDAQGKMVTCSDGILSEQGKFPPLLAALGGKMASLTTDTTKVGGIWCTSGYQYASKSKIPAGGTWLVCYATSFPYTGDRAVGTDIAVAPGGFQLGQGMYAWWNMCIRIS